VEPPKKTEDVTRAFGISSVGDLLSRYLRRDRASHRVLPLGLKEKFRNLTYRGTEEVVYLEYGSQGFGLRPADRGCLPAI